jgi:hypothetical protein
MQTYMSQENLEDRSPIGCFQQQKFLRFEL